MASRCDPATLACSIERALAIVGERWSLLIVREAMLGVERFADFRERLGIASDVLSDRLGKLVDAGVLERVAYREAGSRERAAYRLTGAGEDLRIVLGALDQWGEAHVPAARPAPTHFVRTGTGERARVGFVDSQGSPLADRDVVALRSPVPA